MNSKKIMNRPLYRQLVEAIEEDFISRAKANEALPTEPELAFQYHVSVTTVRKAVDLLEEKGQVKRRQGSGTYILQNRVVRRLALLIDHDVFADNASPVISSVFRNFHYCASQEGFQLTSHFGKRRLGHAPVVTDLPEGFLNSLRSGRVDGVVVIGSLPLDHWINIAKHNGIPVVGNSQGFESSVCWDEENFFRMAFHTAQLNGKRKVAFIAGQRPEVRLNQSCEKTEDLARSLAAEYGLTTHKEWIRNDYSVYFPGAGWELFRDLWSSREEKPDCLIANEFPLFDIMDAAARAGIKPVSELLLIASTSEGNKARYPYPVVRIETGNELLLARTLLEEITRRMNGEAARHLLIPSTRIIFDQTLYSQIPALAKIAMGNSFAEPLLPESMGEANGGAVEAIEPVAC